MRAEPSFDAALREHGAAPLRRDRVRTIQINLGKVCNMACLHCHVGAGPNRTESMTRDVAERAMALLAASPGVEVVDLTGGAPELNPHFRWLVEQARSLGKRVIDRCNLTVLLEPGLSDLPAFLAEHDVEVVASLPCYGPENLEKQRGRGAFDASIRALRLLNALGYGRPGSRRRLDLVYNPVGASLPPPQEKLEVQYKGELSRSFGLEFHRLLTIANMPIERFAHALRRDGRLDVYVDLLVSRFNSDTVPALMCRELVSVSWDGSLHDCDFHQACGLAPGAGARSIWDVDSLTDLEGTPITTARHCFGCTAGAGSSCSGALR